MTETRNILIIGRTGSGKSTLANVLINKNGSFEEVFEESSGGVSMTRDIQVEEFEIGRNKYRIIDTPGIGDTKLSEEEVLEKIAETAYFLKNGLSQVLFVTNGRFDKTEMLAYKLAKIFLSSAGNDVKCITIVRTCFGSFRNSDTCRKDINVMLNNGGELSEVVRRADREERIIHVNNPTLDIKGAAKNELNKNKQKRFDSQNILFEHLQNNCQETYFLGELSEFNKRISKHVQKIETLRKTSGRRENEELICREKVIIYKETRQYLQEKGIDWREIVDYSLQGAALLVSIAAIVVPVACKIM